MYLLRVIHLGRKRAELESGSAGFSARVLKKPILHFRVRCEKGKVKIDFKKIRQWSFLIEKYVGRCI